MDFLPETGIENQHDPRQKVLGRFRQEAGYSITRALWTINAAAGEMEGAELEQMGHLRDALEKASAFTIIPPEDVGKSDWELSTQLDRGLRHLPKDRREDLVEFVRAAYAGEERAVAAMNRDLLLASKAVYHNDKGNYRGMGPYDVRALEQSDLLTIKGRFGRYTPKDLLGPVTPVLISVAVVNFQAMTTQFWMGNPDALLNQGVAFMAAMSTVVAQGWNKERKVRKHSREYEKDLNRRTRDADMYEDGRSELRMRELGAEGLVLADQIQARFSDDLLRVGAGADLLSKMARSDQEVWLGEVKSVVGYLPETYLRKRQSEMDRVALVAGDMSEGEVGQIGEESGLANLARFTDRAVQLFDVFAEDYNVFAESERIEMALDKAGEPKKGLWRRGDYYWKVAKEFVPSMKGINLEKLRDSIEEYVKLKQRFLSCEADEVGEVRRDIVSCLADVDQLKFGSKWGMSRRDFLRNMGVAGAGVALGSSVYGELGIGGMQEAMGAREKLDVDDGLPPKTDEFQEVFFRFKDDEYFMGMDGEELLYRMAELHSLVDLYWRGEDSQISTLDHTMEFFQELFDSAKASGLGPREVLYFYRIAAQNIGNREGQNRDVDIGSKQILLANVIQAIRSIGIDPVAEEFVDMAILGQTTYLLDTVRTAQDITLGIHDMEVSILAQALVDNSDMDGSNRGLTETAEDLVAKREAIEEAQLRIRQDVLGSFWSRIPDKKELLEQLLDDKFLEEIGIGDRVRPSQLTNYTRTWAIAEKKQHLSEEVLRETAAEWKREYQGYLDTDPQEGLKKLLLDQGKLTRFWRKLGDVAVVKESGDLEKVRERILDRFEDLEDAVGEMISSRDEFTTLIGRREYDMAFQISLGTAVVKKYAQKAEVELQRSGLFDHVHDETEREKFRTYFMLSIREIASSEVLVRAENQFPQDRLAALPYNHEMSLFGLSQLTWMLQERGYLSRDFNWTEWSEVMGKVNRGENPNPEIREYFEVCVGGISNYRANEGMAMMNQYGGVAVAEA